MDESDALPLCGDWLEGGQRSAAASFGRQTRGRCENALRCDLDTRPTRAFLHRRTRVSKAPQEGSRRLSWALRHSHSIHMRLMQLSSSGRICYCFSVTCSAGAGLPYTVFMHKRQIAVSNETFVALSRNVY